MAEKRARKPKKKYTLEMIEKENMEAKRNANFGWKGKKAEGDKFKRKGLQSKKDDSESFNLWIHQQKCLSYAM